jgi:acyl-CoA thioester hydrolase
MHNPEAAIRRKKGGYFELKENDPAPVRVRLKKRVAFNEADVMGVVWHGNYPKYFEEAAAELGRKCGLSYRAYYEAGIQAPIVQFHADYHKPLFLDEEFTVEAVYVWSEGARLHTEYSVIRHDGTLAVSGYTVQMFIQAQTKEPLLVSPAVLEDCRRRWRAGEFK